jgi:hypothetical protein
VSLDRPEIYAELVFDRGWSPEEYEEWLATTLKQQLLRQVRETKKRPRAKSDRGSRSRSFSNGV